ncbi:hypothetical protein OAO01_07400 [Oligoflexia bacterium]|nr:hypothetical protein [Oligoflexia bacterium]
MDMEEGVLRDRNGIGLKDGNFIMLTETVGGIIAGPYRYCGFRHGTHIFRIGDMDFAASVFKPDLIELLPEWKIWRKKEYYFKRFEELFESHCRKRAA